MQLENVAQCMGVGVPSSQLLQDSRFAGMGDAECEAPEISAALQVVTPGDTVLELGSGLGLVGSVVAVNAAPKRIYAFETNPHLLPYARALYDANGLADVVTVENRVLTCDPNAADTLTCTVDKVSVSKTPQDTKQQVDVETGDFNGFCAYARPNVLIMNIEGREADLIRNGDLSGFRAIVIEFHPDIYGLDEMQQLKTHLASQGFEKVEKVSTHTLWACVRA